MRSIASGTTVAEIGRQHRHEKHAEADVEAGREAGEDQPLGGPPQLLERGLDLLLEDVLVALGVVLRSLRLGHATLHPAGRSTTGACRTETPEETADDRRHLQRSRSADRGLDRAVQAPTVDAMPRRSSRRPRGDRSPPGALALPDELRARLPRPLRSTATAPQRRARLHGAGDDLATGPGDAAARSPGHVVRRGGARRGRSRSCSTTCSSTATQAIALPARAWCMPAAAKPAA